MKKMLVAIAGAAALCAFGALKDVAGNAVTAETPFGDVDGETGTVGELVRAGGAAETNGIPTNVSQLANDAGYVTEAVTNGLLRAENDPLFTAWTNRETIAAGKNAEASAERSVAVGGYSNAKAVAAAAFGAGSVSTETSATALGSFSRAKAPYSVAIGHNSYAGDTTSVVIGANTRSHGVDTFSVNAETPSAFYLGDRTLQSFLDAYAKPSVTNGLASKAEVDAKADSVTVNGLLQTVDEHDAAIQAVEENNEQTRQIVTTWENFLDGSNVVFSITNYLSGAYNLDAAKLKVLELRDGAYKEVYNSRDEILLHIDNFKTNDFRVATNQVIGAISAAIGNKADRDWGKYTSAGGEAPENTVYMTAPNTVFAGGLEYERVAVGEGAVCVLTAHGAPVWAQGDEGTFKFQDDGGTNFFGFAKTDSYTIGANTDGITVQSGIVTLTYSITMSGRPCVWHKSSLAGNAAWEQLNLPDGSPVSGASHAVTWEQNPPAGTQVCYINVGDQPSGFFRSTVEATGESKFMTNMKADLSGGIMCTNTQTGVMGVIKPAFDGTTVQWSWSEN